MVDAGKGAAQDESMNTLDAGAPATDTALPLQDGAAAIARAKYFLPGEDLAGMRRRLARALAAPEADPGRWEARFLRVLDHAFPAGRIMANAGAEAHKPRVSTINCTVSRTLGDSMADIMQAASEAALTLKAGCGIGYDFSTLRPRGAPVSGAGATTSGPLPFMDVFDAVCRTVSSAGGRRGAQMGCIEISHPDIEDFITAKREAGRLRNFNLSCLVTRDFLEAVRSDAQWPLVFPAFPQEIASLPALWRHWPAADPLHTVDEHGRTCCRIYRRVRARALWDLVMRSTYSHSDPGFILIDECNRMNPLWFAEDIRATNPCVTGDTRLATQHGLIPIAELQQRGLAIDATVDRRALGDTRGGVSVRPARPAFMTAARARVYRVVTAHGYEIKATAWHDFYTERGKLKLRDLCIGDRVLVQSGKGQFGVEGSEDLGQLLGLLTGDGHFTNRGDDKEAAVINLWGEERALAQRTTAYVNTLIAGAALHGAREYSVSAVAVPDRQLVLIRSIVLARLLEHYGFNRATKLRVPEVVWRGSEVCVRAYLQALFQTDGTVNVSERSQSCSIRLASSKPDLLQEVQRLLANFGIFCSVRARRAARIKAMPDGRGGQRDYVCRADHELIIDGESRERFMCEIGFLLPAKTQRYEAWVRDKRLLQTQRFSSPIVRIEPLGEEPVFDTTQPDHNTVIFNGLVTGQCGEQPLPPYGACLLGSINLASFVQAPFTARARFDFAGYEAVIGDFARMLDNVCELSGLPLAEQRAEMLRKRRHGMGYFGLGSALVMLGVAYGSSESIDFTAEVSKRLALGNWRAALALAREKGPAPLLAESVELTPAHLLRCPDLVRDGYQAGNKLPARLLHARYSTYMQRIATLDASLVEALGDIGARYTHATSIAPTGTMAASVGNNASNGIEPSFAHRYIRNMIVPGEKAKRAVAMESYELLRYRQEVDAAADADALPALFGAASAIAPRAHIDVQAAAQYWIDASISKTVNVPTDIDFSEFQQLYLYAAERGLKGCTTFRFNPEVHQGVLVQQADLAGTLYRFTLADGSTVQLAGDAEVEYEGGRYTAANLYDALKEGFYGRL